MEFSHKLNKYKKKYLNKVYGASHVKPKKKSYKYFIIIPAYNENNYIHFTLKSIAKQKKELIKGLLVIIVINNSNISPNKVYNNNLDTYNSLIKNIYNFEIIIIDCFSKGLALDEKKSGVGLARKIGMDYCIEFGQQDSVLCSIDADTLLHKNYLSIVSNEFKKSIINVAVVNFKHQNSSDSNIQKAINEYENLLKKIAKNLRSIGSPYGFVNMGSTIICTINAYIAVGGMSPKKATEDFYFLQKLAKYDTVHTIKNILVYPSPRAEQRVYLGTGFRMEKYLQNKSLTDLYIDDRAYKCLKYFYTIINNKWDSTSTEILSSITGNNSKLKHYLTENNFIYKIEKIQKNSINKRQFLNQFHKWFDSLKIYKFLKIYGN